MFRNNYLSANAASVRLQAALLCLLGMWLTGVSHAQLVIEITEGADDALPVAVVPFGWDGDGEAPYDIAAVVDADLKRSGRFAPLERSRMLERPTTGSEVDYEDWLQFQAEVVVVGRLEPAGSGQTKVIFQVMDVPRRQQLLAYSLTARDADLRTIAHYISDVIYESLIGEPGVFSTRIAYVSANARGALRYALIVADADGENQREIVRSDGPIMSPAWSPDGTRLAYVLFEDNGPAIYVQNVATGDRRIVSQRRGVNGAPAWSPDGSRMALTLSNESGNLDIFVLTLASGDLQQITTHPSIDTEAAWSADGSALFFNSDRSGGPQVYMVSADGGPAKRVTFQGNYNARPRVSPDGERLAVVHNDGGNYRIAVVDVQGSDTLVVSQGRLDESPSFAPNGSTLIYAAQGGATAVLETVSVDGRIRQRLASRGLDVREPVWGPLGENRLQARQRNQ